MEGQFDRIDADEMETYVQTWSNELKRLSSVETIAIEMKQVTLLTFLFKALEYFKQFLPMVKALRTKGLGTRHF